MSGATTPRPSGPDLLRTIAAGTAAEVGTAFLRSLVRHVAQALDVEIAFVAEVEPGGWEHATVLASWGRDGVELPEGAAYEIPGTPCELAAGQDLVTLPSGAREAFPATRSSPVTASRATWRSSCAARTAPASATSA